MDALVRGKKQWMIYTHFFSVQFSLTVVCIHFFQYSCSFLERPPVVYASHTLNEFAHRTMHGLVKRCGLNDESVDTFDALEDVQLLGLLGVSLCELGCSRQDACFGAQLLAAELAPRLLKLVFILCFVVELGGICGKGTRRVGQVCGS